MEGCTRLEFDGLSTNRITLINRIGSIKLKSTPSVILNCNYQHLPLITPILDSIWDIYCAGVRATNPAKKTGAEMPLF